MGSNASIGTLAFGVKIDTAPMTVGANEAAEKTKALFTKIEADAAKTQQEMAASGKRMFEPLSQLASLISPEMSKMGAAGKLAFEAMVSPAGLLVGSLSVLALKAKELYDTYQKIADIEMDSSSIEASSRRFQSLRSEIELAQSKAKTASSGADFNKIADDLLNAARREAAIIQETKINPELDEAEQKRLQDQKTKDQQTLMRAAAFEAAKLKEQGRKLDDAQKQYELQRIKEIDEAEKAAYLKRQEEMEKGKAAATALVDLFKGMKSDVPEEFEDLDAKAKRAAERAKTQEAELKKRNKESAPIESQSEFATRGSVAAFKIQNDAEAKQLKELQIIAKNTATKPVTVTL